MVNTLPRGNLWTYGIVKSRLVLKAINRETPSTAFVTILIRFRYDGSSLLCRATHVDVEMRQRRVGNIHVVCCILPDVSVVERLYERK